MLRRLWILLLLCALTLSGCSELSEVENIAYAIILGADLSEDDRIQITIQIPTITGQMSESSSSESGGSDHLVYSATGESFATALDKLKWAVPRPIDLSQIELILISEPLARSSRYKEITTAMMDTYRLYTAARLAICEGSAREFIESQTMLIGSRQATDLTSMFEDFVYNGYIPDVQFADVFYKSVSIYSDPLAIYAVKVDSEQEPSESAAPALALTIPEDPRSDDVDATQPNRFLGAAVLVDSQMVGRLNGSELLCCNLLRGKHQTLTISDGSRSASLSLLGSPKIDVDIHSEPIRISIGMRLSLTPDSRYNDLAAMESLLERKLQETISACKQLKAEPFEFAEVAARSFLTIDDWLAFGWREQFLNSVVDVDVQIHQDNL